MRRKSRRLRLLALRLLADRHGVAAIEFAMLLPVMLVLFFGTVELSSGVAANRKVTLMAQTLSDLTSRSISVANSDLSNFFAAGAAIMTPYGQPTSARITELWINPSTGSADVQWSQGWVAGCTSVPCAGAPAADPIAFPSALIAKDSNGVILPGQYLIYSEVKYTYKPAVGYVMAKTGITLSDVTYTRPRVWTCVVYPTPASGALLPPCPTS